MLTPEERDLLLKQHNRTFRAVWHGEMVEPHLPELPADAAFVVNQAHRHDFSVHAFHLFENREPGLYLIMSPEVSHDEIGGDTSIERAASLLQAIHKPGHEVLDFLLEPASPTGERSLLVPEATRAFNQVLRERHIEPRRIADRELRLAETIAAQTGTDDEWIERHVARADGIVRAIGDYFSTSDRQAIALLNLNHGCNPFLYDQINHHGISYVAVAPRYDEVRQRRTHLLFEHHLNGRDWFFALDTLRDIKKLLDGNAELASQETPVSVENHQGRYQRIDVQQLLYRTAHGNLTVRLESTRQEEGKQSQLAIRVPRQSLLARDISDYIASL